MVNKIITTVVVYFYKQLSCVKFCLLPSKIETGPAAGSVVLFRRKASIETRACPRNSSASMKVRFNIAQMHMYMLCSTVDKV